MIRKTWLRRLQSLFAPRIRSIVRKSDQKPRLESLEDRLAPATFTWTGAGTTANWSNPANWQQGMAPSGQVNSSGYGDDLVFSAGAKQTSPINDITNGTFNSITFAGSNYSISGNAIFLGTAAANSGYLIGNSGAMNDTISFNIQMGVTGNAFQYFTVNSNSVVTLSGKLSGTTSTISKEGAGTLILSADNSGFTGPISVDTNSGILEITNANALGSSASGTVVGTNSQLLIGNVVGTIKENLTLNGFGPDGTGALNNLSGNNTLGGNITLASPSSIGSDSGSLLTITGVIGQYNTQTLTKVGQGSLALVGANNYSGGTVIENGILKDENVNALGFTDGTAATGVLVEYNYLTNDTGTLQLIDPNYKTDGGGFTIQNVLLTLNGPGDSRNGAIDNVQGNNTWTGNVVLGSVPPNSYLPFIGAEAPTASIPNTTLTITPNSSGVGGIVEDNPAVPKQHLTIEKRGGGTVIFAGANTYLGTTQVDAGTLEMTNSNQYTGGTYIEPSARVIITDSQALGQVGKAGIVVVFNTATLQLDVPQWLPTNFPDLHADSVTGTYNSLSITNNLPIYLKGTGINNVGALYSDTGINTITSDVSFEFYTKGPPYSDLIYRENSIGVAADPHPSNSISYLTNDYHLMITGHLFEYPQTYVDAFGDQFYHQVMDKVGAGQLIIPVDNTQTFQGDTDIKQGWITIGTSGSIGESDPANYSVNQTTVENGASLQMLSMNPDGTPNPKGTITLTQNLILTGLGITHPYAGISQEGALLGLDGTETTEGYIYLNGNVGIGQQSLLGFGGTPEMYLGNQIRDGQTITTGGIIKLGSQRVDLLTDGTYHGNVDVQQGALVVQNNAGLGLPNAGTVTVESNTSLEIMGSEPNYNGQLTDLAGNNLGLEVWNKPLILKGSGDTTLGDYSPLMNLQGDNAWRGNITLANTMALDIAPNSTFSVFGVIDDAANTSVNGSDLFVANGGELQLYGANTYRGTTFVGARSNVSSVSLNVSGGTLGSAYTVTLGYDPTGSDPNGTGPNYQTASAVLNVGASTATVQSVFLGLLAKLGESAESVAVSQTGTLTNTTYTITFLGSYPTPKVTATGSPAVTASVVSLYTTPSTLTVNGPTGSPFFLTLGSNTTELFVGNSAANVQNALIAMLNNQGITGQTVTVTLNGSVYSIGFTGAVAPPALSATGSSGVTAVLATTYTTKDTLTVQGVATSPYTLQLGTGTTVLQVGASAATVQAAIQAMLVAQGITTATVNVTLSTNTSTTPTTYTYTINYTGSTPQPVLSSSGSPSVTTAVGTGTIPADLTVDGILTVASNLALGNPVTPQVQTVTVVGKTGSYILTFNGYSTTLAATATATQIQTALNGLASISGLSGSVTVSQGTITGGVVNTITFGGSLAGFRQNLIVASVPSTGTNPSVTTAIINSGSGGIWVDKSATMQLQGNITIAGKPLMVQGSGDGSIPSSMPVQWFDLGSAPTTNANTINGSGNTSGRVTGVAFNPFDSSIIFISTAGGGAWESKNGGITWVPIYLTGQVAFSGAIAVNPFNPQNIFLGTGNTNNSPYNPAYGGSNTNSSVTTDSYYGTGVYESLDGGITWSLVVNTADGSNPLYGTSISSIVIDRNYRSNGDFYVAASDQATNAPTGNAGVWRFDGTSWYNLTSVVSFGRENVTSNLKNPPPLTPGPDDDYRLSFPQYQATWTSLQFAGNVLYACLSCPDGDNDNGVYRIYDPESASGGNGNFSAPQWFVGNGTLPVDNPVIFDTESTTEFPTADIQTFTTTGPFNVSFNGSSTNIFGPLPANIGAIGLEQALDSLPSIGGVENGGVVVYASGTYTYEVFFQGKAVGQMQVYDPFGNPITVTDNQYANTNVVMSVDPTSVIENDYANFVPETYDVYAATTYAGPTFSTPGVTHQILFSNTAGNAWNPSVNSGASVANYQGTLGNFASSILANNGVVYIGGYNQILQGSVNVGNGNIAWTDITKDAKGNSPGYNFHAIVQDDTYGNLDTTSQDGNLYVATDGGIYKYNNNAWTSLNSNLSITEYNSISTSPVNVNVAIGGAQTDGAATFSGSLLWSYVAGSNATQVVIDPENAQNVLIAYENNIYKSTSGVNGPFTKLTGYGNGAPITSLIIDPVNSNRILMANGSLWQSVDGGLTWHSLGQSANIVAPATYQGPYIKDPAFPTVTDQGTSTYVPNVVYTATASKPATSLTKAVSSTLSVTKTTGLSWVIRTPNFGTAFTTITAIEVDPTNSNTVYVVANQAQKNAPAVGGVWMSTNAGQSWTQLPTLGLPALPAWTIVLDPRTGNLYLGTDNGVFQLAAGGTGWTQFGSGIDNVQVKQLDLNQTLNTLTAGTYGQGMHTLYLQDFQMQPNGGALRSVSGTAVWTGPVILTGPTTLSAVGSQSLQNGISAASLNIVGVISDSTLNTTSNTLTKLGYGNVILSGANTYGGLTDVKQGFLVVNNSQALGSTGMGTTVEFGAALALESSVSGEPLNLYGNGASILNGHYTGALYNLANNNTYSGPIELLTLPSTPTPPTPPLPTTISDVTIGVSSGTQLTISSVIDDAKSPGGAANLDKELTGTLVLSAANTYRGNTNIFQGTLVAQNGQALGLPAASAPPSTTKVYDGSALQLQGGITVNNETLDLSGTGITSGGALISSGGANTWAGLVALTTIPGFNPTTTPATNVSINVSTAKDTLTLDQVGQLNGNFGLTKIGLGTLILPNADTYAGVTQISNGIVDIKNNTSLGIGGTPPSSGAVVSSGATLQLDNNITVTGETLTLNGTGIAGATNGGALVNNTGANTWAGPVAINTNATISVLPSTSLNVSGVLSGTLPLTVSGGGLLQVSNAANTFSAITTVTAGDLQVDGLLAAITLNGATSAGAVLSGSGTVGNVTTGTGGTVSPGDNAPGTLSTNLESWTNKTTFNVHINSGGNSLLQINGQGVTNTFNLSGASLTGVANFGGIAPYGTTYTVLQTINGVTLTGNFGNLTGNSIKLGNYTFTVTITSTQVQLTLQKGAQATVSITPNNNLPTPSNYGQAVSYTIKVAPQSGGPAFQTGDTVTITFTDTTTGQTMTYSPVVLTNNQVTFTPGAPFLDSNNYLPVGSYTLTALFNGDINYNPATNTYNQTVNPITPTVVLTSSSGTGFTSFLGQVVTITATVSTGVTTINPNGTVTLSVTPPGGSPVNNLSAVSVTTGKGVMTATFILDSTVLTSTGNFLNTAPAQGSTLSYRLLATFTPDTGVTNVTSATSSTSPFIYQYVANAVAPLSITLNPVNGDQAAGYNFSATGTVTMPSGSSSNGVPITVNVYTDSALTQLYKSVTTNAAANGTYSASLNLPTLSGATSTKFYLQAVSATNSTIVSASQSVVVVTPKLVFTSIPTSVAVNSSFALAVSAVDPLSATNATLSNFTGLVSLAVNTGPGPLGGTTSVNAVNGVATFSTLSLGTVGTYTLSAQSSGSTTGVSGSLTVYNPYAIASIALVPGSAVSNGLGFTAKIEALNAFGQVITNYNNTATISVSSGPGSISGPVTVSFVNGVATFTNNVSTSGNYTFLVTVIDKSTGSPLTLTTTFGLSFFSRGRR